MKCCMGKSGKAPVSFEIPTDMATTKIEKVDAVFEDAGSVLQSAEDIRAGLQDTKATCMTVSGAYTLKEGTMSDALTLFLWSVGANTGVEDLAGSIKPNIDLETGEFSMELESPLSEDCQEFYDAFKTWCKTVLGAVESIQGATEKVQECADKAKELSGTISSDASEAGLSFMDTAKAIKNVGTNIATIGKGAAKLGSLAQLAPVALADLKNLATGMPALLKEASTNVTEGKKKSLKTMAEFAEKHHSKEKVAPEEAKKHEDKVIYDAKNKDDKKSEKASDAKGEKPKVAEAAEINPDEAKPEEGKTEVATAEAVVAVVEAAAEGVADAKAEEAVKPEDVKPDVEPVAA